MSEILSLKQDAEEIKYGFGNKDFFRACAGNGCKNFNTNIAFASKIFILFGEDGVICHCFGIFINAWIRADNVLRIN